MNTLRMFGFISIFGSAFTLVACNGGGSFESRSPEERVGAVQDAIANPTGNVDASNAQTILESSQSQAQLNGMSAFFAGVPGLSSGEASAACAVGSSSEGNVDVSCSSEGKASGQVSYKVTASATKQVVEITLDNVCEAGTCLDGSLVAAVELKSSGNVSTIVQASLDTTRDGETRHTDWGYAVNVSEGSVSVDLVMFDDAGSSYVVSASVNSVDATGEITISGSNGKFSCAYDAGGGSGSCTGAGSFTW